MPRFLSQSLRVRAAITPQDVSTQKTSGYFDASGAQRILAAINIAAVGAGKKITAQLMQATDASGTGAKVLGAVVVKTSTPGGTLDLTIDAATDSMDPAYPFVGISLVSDNGATVYGAASLILGNNRYNP